MAEFLNVGASLCLIYLQFHCKRVIIGLHCVICDSTELGVTICHRECETTEAYGDNFCMRLYTAGPLCYIKRRLSITVHNHTRETGGETQRGGMNAAHRGRIQ